MKKLILPDTYSGISKNSFELLPSDVEEKAKDERLSLRDLNQYGRQVATLFHVQQFALVGQRSDYNVPELPFSIKDIYGKNESRQTTVLQVRKNGASDISKLFFDGTTAASMGNGIVKTLVPLLYRVTNRNNYLDEIHGRIFYLPRSAQPLEEAIEISFDLDGRRVTDRSSSYKLYEALIQEQANNSSIHSQFRF